MMSFRTLFVTFALIVGTAILSAEEVSSPPALAETVEVPIRLSFSETTPASEVYRAVGTAAGLEVVFDSKFREHSMTIDIDTATTSDALDLVAAAAGVLWVPIPGNAVIIADDTPQNHREYQPLVVRSFVLENGSVREADKLLRSIVGVRNLAIDEDLRTVTVREPSVKMPIIERMIALADHAPSEFDARVEILRLSGKNTEPPPTRFTAAEFTGWRRSVSAKPLAESSLSLIDGSRADIHLGAAEGTGLALDLRLEGRVHPQCREVTLEVLALLAPSAARQTEGQEPSGRAASARIETTARLSAGSTLLIRVPRSAQEDLAIAITPTIVRGTEFDPTHLEAMWVGTETRIHVSH
jgi:hypothetical protein